MSAELPPAAPPRPKRSAGALWLGWILITGGLLIAITCGFFTADIAGACAQSMPGSQVLVAVIGGVPTMIGAIMAFAGLLVLILAGPRQPPNGAA